MKNLLLKDVAHPRQTRKAQQQGSLPEHLPRRAEKRGDPISATKPL